ncbi:SGNH hydrolase-type esterase domain-containing protein [Diplogelasinospora grovesii]|uniref:SGNH hydrolase-type esterase domain-containing protein n=1 Tax=Diplogelasinospora grovesii TaxID=303347 RepID=A0AAN6S446_9PEZI|nr:SGNH hydrolase-type esterase domain-containing protein [Diplogelasinospora grovesii]
MPRQDADFDETDLTFISNLAAIGDSYSAGIGAGDRLGNIGQALDKQSDWACSRYDHSYPYLVYGDPRFGDGYPNFQFLSCSGAVTVDVLEHQIPNLNGNQDAIMLSISGNDVELTNILNQCIYQWAVFNWEQVAVAEIASKFKDKYDWAAEYDFFPLGRGCDGQLSRTADLIASSAFSSSLDAVLSAAKAKLASGGKIYWTGYAKFFAEDLSSDCDSVTWTTWIHVSGLQSQPTQYLTSDHRRTMNSLVDQVNAQLAAAAERAGDSVIFVNYNRYVSEFGSPRDGLGAGLGWDGRARGVVLKCL